MFCITCIIHQRRAAAHCSHANALLICLLQTHQGENEKVVSHRGTAPPLTTCCHVEEPPQVKQDCAMHLLLLVTLYWICVYTGWSEQMVTSGGLVCMVGDAKMLSTVQFAASTRGTEPGRSRTSASVLPAGPNWRFTTGCWRISLLSITSDSDHNNLLVGMRGVQRHWCPCIHWRRWWCPTPWSKALHEVCKN